MRDYFLCLFAASVISSVVGIIACGSNFEKVLKYVCSVVCIALVVFPLTQIELEAEGFDISTASHDGADLSQIQKETEASFKSYVSELLSENFGIICTRVSIDLYSEQDEITVSSVTVYINGGDTKAVEEYLEEKAGGDISVVNENQKPD